MKNFRQEPALFGKGESADNYETGKFTFKRNRLKHFHSNKRQGTRSAICGGTTTLITFAPQKKSEPSLLAALEATHALAKGNCYSDYSFHLICSNAGPVAISEVSCPR